MSYPTCADCGSKVYGGHCVWCHEETYIAQQYRDLGETVPESIMQAEIEQEQNPSQTETEYKNGVAPKRGN